MREVTLTIAKLGLIVGNTIEIKLVNSIGNPLISASGYFLNKKIVLSSEIFEISLLENEHIDTISNYKLTLPNNTSFTFKVPMSNETVPHEMLSLMRIGCVKEIFDEDLNCISLAFQEKLEQFFLGNKNVLTKEQQDIEKLYEYYADSVIDTESTIDVMKMMDNCLSTIREV